VVEEIHLLVDHLLVIVDMVQQVMLVQQDRVEILVSTATQHKLEI
jgi:hypothetical protein